MTDARPVVLIDFSALFRRAWHVQSDVSHAYESTIGGVNRACAMFENPLVAICCDGKGNWRKALAPTYKAQRESQPQSMYGEIDRTLDRLRKDGRLVWKFDGFEADDVIATATMCAKTRGHCVTIVSHDKDLLQLLGPCVDFLAIHKQPWETVKDEIVMHKYGVEPSQFGDWLALVGDSSDNIKGCPGVGGKTATAMLQSFGSIDGIYERLADENPENVFSPNQIKNLNAHTEDVKLARMLVSLSNEVPLRFDEIYETREIAENEGDPMSEAEKDAEKYFGPGEGIIRGFKDQADKIALEVLKNSGDTGKPQDGATTEVATKAQDCPSQPEQELVFCPVATAPVESKKELARSVSDSGEPTDLILSDSGKTAEIATAVEYSRQLEPRSLREASIFADMMFYSKVYSRYPTKQSMIAAIVRGREMGYGAGASLDIFHVADFNRDGNLRLMLHAHVIIERAMRDPGLEYFALVSSDATECTYEAKVKRNPKPTTLTYTIEDAKNAGLVRTTINGQPNNWMKRPTELLRKTCGVQLSRIVAPWAGMNLYCPEELGVDYE